MYVGSLSRSQRWNAQRFEAGALQADGHTWLVTAADGKKGPWGIAEQVVGDGNRWRELIRANPKKPVNPATGNFKNLWAGEVLVLPASWIKPAVAPVVVGPAATVAAPPVVAFPAIPTPAAAVATGGASVSSADVIHTKGLLIAWATFAGNASQGLSDYGARAEDMTPVWTARDRYEASVFLGAPSAAGIQWSLELMAALDAWAASHLTSSGASASGVVTSPGWQDAAPQLVSTSSAATDAALGHAGDGLPAVVPVIPVPPMVVSGHASVGSVAKPSGGGGGMVALLAVGGLAYLASRRGGFVRVRRRGRR